MGSMSRRMMRNARRRLGELTDRVYDNIAGIAGLAEHVGEDALVDWCENALDRIRETLTVDGLPTDETQRLLPVLIDGVADELRKLQPAIDSPESSAA